MVRRSSRALSEVRNLDSAHAKCEGVQSTTPLLNFRACSTRTLGHSSIFPKFGKNRRLRLRIKVDLWDVCPGPVYAPDPAGGATGVDFRSFKVENVETLIPRSCRTAACLTVLFRFSGRSCSALRGSPRFGFVSPPLGEKLGVENLGG
jgi:hypothetical protein